MGRCWGQACLLYTSLAGVDDPFAQRKIIFIAVAHRHQQVAVLGAVFLRGGKAFFPGGFQPVVPADAQFFQLGGLFRCQAARALPGLYLPLELKPLAHGHAAVDGIALSLIHIWDFCPLQYNYLDTDDRAAEISGDRGYQLTEELNIPLIIMEPIKGGTLANLPPEAEAPLKACLLYTSRCV